jgi:carboxymethylenebutenolidase
MNQSWKLLALALLLVPAAGYGAPSGTRADPQRIAEQHRHDAPTPTPAATAAPAQEVTGEEVTYGEANGKPLKGFLARPKNAAGPLPGLIVIHEWWGLNDNVRAMTRRLAGEGYAALAVDLYGGKVAEDAESASQLVLATDEEGAIPNLSRAYDFLKNRKARKVGVLGWCFGGGWSLQTAIALGNKLGAVVIYYGRPDFDRERLGKLGAPVLGLFGGKDQGIPVESVRKFESTLKELGKSVEIHVYDTADHAFANPSGGNYNAEAAKDAWEKTRAFLKKNLAP